MEGDCKSSVQVSNLIQEFLSSIGFDIFVELHPVSTTILYGYGWFWNLIIFLEMRKEDLRIPEHGKFTS